MVRFFRLLVILACIGFLPSIAIVSIEVVLGHDIEHTYGATSLTLLCAVLAQLFFTCYTTLEGEAGYAHRFTLLIMRISVFSAAISPFAAFLIVVWAFTSPLSGESPYPSFEVAVLYFIFCFIVSQNLYGAVDPV